MVNLKVEWIQIFLFINFLHVNFAVGRKEACGVVIASPCYIIPNIIIGGTPIIMTSYRQPTVLD